ncbi:MAG: hypothetical protein IT385_15345 [Deltaproteobacteria bacterium]|nr:hypothetical protein [Deltaproteobacteria bacterium]
MKRIVTTTLTLALVGGTTLAFAKKNEEFQGKPDKFEVGKLNTGVWHDEDGHHIRFSTAGKVDRVYSGKVCAEKIVKVDGHQLEANDKLELGDDAVCVTFTFNTDGHVDGFDFRADGAGITYELNIDGKPIPQGQILIGAGNVHPKKNPFVLNRL